MIPQILIRNLNASDWNVLEDRSNNRDLDYHFSGI